MAPTKQAQRASLKKEKKVAADEPEEKPNSGGSLQAQMMALVKRSVIFNVAPCLPDILKDLKTELTDGAKAKEEKPAEATAEPTEEESNEVEGESKTDTQGTDVVPDFEVNKKDAASVFNLLKLRLSGFNALGMFRNSEETVQAFLKLKTLEFDGGPKAKKKGNPALDRLAANFHDFAAQYIGALFLLMVLRSFLLRSFFACLPWMCFYQVVSIMLPLMQTAKIPVPLEKLPLGARVALTMLFHGLIWLFFVYEVVFKAYWLEWFLYTALFVGHAYAFRSAEA